MFHKVYLSQQDGRDFRKHGGMVMGFNHDSVCTLTARLECMETSLAFVRCSMIAYKLILLLGRINI